MSVLSKRLAPSPLLCALSPLPSFSRHNSCPRPHIVRTCTISPNTSVLSSAFFPFLKEIQRAAPLLSTWPGTKRAVRDSRTLRRSPVMHPRPRLSLQHRPKCFQACQMIRRCRITADTATRGRPSTTRTKDVSVYTDRGYNFR